MARPTSRTAEYRECLEAGMTAKETAEKMGVVLSTVSSWAKYYGVKFAAHSGPLADLTDREREDHGLLVDKAGYSSVDALRAIIGPKRKVRAPTMAELDQLSQQRAQGGQ